MLIISKKTGSTPLLLLVEHHVVAHVMTRKIRVTVAEMMEEIPVQLRKLPMELPALMAVSLTPAVM